MKTKLINNDQQKTFAMVLDSGEDVLKCLQSFAKEQNLNATQFTAIGALQELTVGFFDFTIKDYIKIEIKEQVEVLTLAGDISLYKGDHKVHAHIAVAKKDGTAHGGHLLRGITHPTMEIILTESPSYLKRRFDEESGLTLIYIDQKPGKIL